eukprot:4296252-Pleurochrysis_carterae.AAC.1
MTRASRSPAALARNARVAGHRRGDAKSVQRRRPRREDKSVCVPRRTTRAAHRCEGNMVQGLAK